MFEIAEQTGQFDFEEWNLESWPKVIGWILNNQNDLATKIRGHFGSGFGAKGRHPLMGFGIERHSVYATMCNSHENNDWYYAYRLLQLQLLLAQIVLTRRYTTMEEYEADAGDKALLEKKASPYNAAFAVRLLSKNAHTDMLSVLPEPQSPEEYLKALSLVGDVGDDTKRLVAFTVFLEKAFSLQFQTKDLDSLLNEYTITADGRLIEHYKEYEETPEEERPAYGTPEWEKPIGRLLGSMRVKAGSENDVDTEHHGWIQFYGGRDSGEWFGTHGGLVLSVDRPQSDFG